jgi:hypothetical protein
MIPARIVTLTKFLTRLIWIGGISGCFTASVYLVNGKGERVRCDGRGESLDACIKKWEASGYRHETEPQIPPNATDLTISSALPGR